MSRIIIYLFTICVHFYKYNANAQHSIEKIVAELNQFHPKHLAGFPSTLDILADEKLKGRLKIAPKLIVAGGENIRKETRQKLKNAFGCPIRTTYATTEGGIMACECKCGHLHLNDDWIILEAVDKDNNPVKDGEESEKVLMTCMFDYTQPKIRYEITDRVRIYHGRCACGSKKPRIEVDGRSMDILHFIQNDKCISISPMVLPFKKIMGLSNFQFILHPNNRCELRLDIKDGYEKMNVFEEAAKEFKIFLNENGIIDYKLILSEIPPQIDSKTGKFRQTFQVKQ